MGRTLYKRGGRTLYRGGGTDTIKREGKDNIQGDDIYRMCQCVNYPVHLYVFPGKGVSASVSSHICEFIT